MHAHTHTLHRPIGVNDSVALLKDSEKRNALSLLLKEERVAECLMGGGGEELFQMWGPKCEKVRKRWVLQL